MTATVGYVVADAKSGAVLFDAVIGSTRLRLANEGAARKNIASFIEKATATKLQRREGGAKTASR